MTDYQQKITAIALEPPGNNTQSIHPRYVEVPTQVRVTPMYATSGFRLLLITLILGTFAAIASMRADHFRAKYMQLNLDNQRLRAELANTKEQHKNFINGVMYREYLSNEQ